MLIQSIHWERKKNSKFSSGSDVSGGDGDGAPSIFYIFQQQLYLNCVNLCVSFTYFMITKSLCIKILVYTHFIWYAMCVALHWNEPLKRVYIDFHRNSNKQTWTRNKQIFSCPVRYTTTVHHLTHGANSMGHYNFALKRNTAQRKA